MFISALFAVQVASLFEVLEELSAAGPIKSHFPQTTENVGQNYGFMLYRTQIPSQYFSKQVELEIAGLRDRGIIFVGQVYQILLFSSIADSVDSQEFIINALRIYVSSVTCWPVNGSEAGVDLVLIQTFLLSLCK